MSTVTCSPPPKKKLIVGMKENTEERNADRLLYHTQVESSVGLIVCIHQLERFLPFQSLHFVLGKVWNNLLHLE